MINIVLLVHIILIIMFDNITVDTDKCIDKVIDFVLDAQIFVIFSFN